MPGALNTNFTNNTNLQNAKMFNKPMDPYNVAKKGYEAMIKGKLNVLAGLSFTQKIFMKMMNLFPKKMIHMDIILGQLLYNILFL